MDFLHAIILSIVEGVTEFLPISSTGHMILTAKLLGINESDFVKSFEIIIQLGAILAIVVMYWKRLFVQWGIWKQIMIAFLPTAIIGFALYKVVKEFLLGNAMVTVAALFIGGVVLILIEKLHKEDKHEIKKVEDITPKQAFIIGLAQSLSIVPGVSRSAATIVGGMLLKLNRKTAVEFSFLLAVPTMVSATGLDIVKTQFHFNQNEIAVLAVGFIGAFVFALLAVKFLLRYVENNNFIAFGIYRIVVAVLFFLFVLQ